MSQITNIDEKKNRTALSKCDRIYTSKKRQK